MLNSTFFQNVCSNKISILCICCFIPAERWTQCIIVHLCRYIYMPACSCNTALIIYPIYNSICCTIVPCIKRTGISKVKTFDCRILTREIINIVKLIFSWSTIIFLLTWNNVISKNRRKIIHKTFSFFCCWLIG